MLTENIKYADVQPWLQTLQQGPRLLLRWL